MPKYYVYCEVHRIDRFEVEADSPVQAAEWVRHADTEDLDKVAHSVTTSDWTFDIDNLKPASWVDDPDGKHDIEIHWDEKLQKASLEPFEPGPWDQAADALGDALEALRTRLSKEP